MIGEGKPIQSSEIRAVVAAETMWRQAHPGRHFSVRAEWKERKERAAGWKKGRMAGSVYRNTQSLRGLNQFHFESSCLVRVT